MVYRMDSGFFFAQADATEPPGASVKLLTSAAPQRSECDLHYMFKEARQLRAKACDWPLTD